MRVLRAAPVRTSAIRACGVTACVDAGPWLACTGVGEIPNFPPRVSKGSAPRRGHTRSGCPQAMKEATRCTLALLSHNAVKVRASRAYSLSEVIYQKLASDLQVVALPFGGAR